MSSRSAAAGSTASTLKRARLGLAFRRGASRMWTGRFRRRALRCAGAVGDDDGLGAGTAAVCAPTLAAGCSVVIKPSEFASASTLEFAALVKEAGLLDWVFNVVSGYGPEAGSALVDHPEVAKVTFTGSDATGARIYAQATASMKRVSLELGGKSPNIVFDDCEVDSAVAGAISGIFAATGQTCIAGSRLLLQNSIRESFTARLVEMGRTAGKGDPMAPDTNTGPVTTQLQYQKVLNHIEIAKAEGARCVLGGRPAMSVRDAVGTERLSFAGCRVGQRSFTWIGRRRPNAACRDGWGGGGRCRWGRFRRSGRWSSRRRGWRWRGRAACRG